MASVQLTAIQVLLEVKGKKKSYFSLSVNKSMLLFCVKAPQLNHCRHRQIWPLDPRGGEVLQCGQGCVPGVVAQRCPQALGASVKPGFHALQLSLPT